MAGLVRGFKGLVYPTSFTVASSTATVSIGNPYQIEYTITPSNATNKKINWSSSDTTVATVDSKGVITAVSVGTCTITGVYSYDGTTVTIAVTTTNVAVTGITLDEDSLDIPLRGKARLHGIITPSNASNKNIIWTSSNTSIATVSDGLVYFVGNGTATITATTEDGGYTDTCTVNCYTPVRGVVLNTKELYVPYGNPQTLIATVNPPEALDKSVTWTSSNTNVATVSSSGVVTYVSDGTCKITCTTTDGGYTATCNIICYVAVTGVTLDNHTLVVPPGATAQLEATVSPSNATNQNIVWTSSNEDIATVDENGLVTHVGIGNCTITVTTEDGGYTDTCDVKCIIPVTGVSLNQSSVTINKFDTLQLTATITPSNATIKTVSWRSSNTSVATVSSAGLVTCVGTGTCTITCTTTDGGYTATCTITGISEYTWGYTGAVQTRTVPATGNYCIQVWGAQGGCSYGSNPGAKGAYAAGTICLTSGMVLCIYVGGQGGTSNSIGSHGGISGGWNGGGSGGGTYYSGGSSSVGGGGGGTDVRYNGNTYYHRFIVAAGGAGGGTQICGSTFKYSCGGGGAASGYGSRPGTQTGAGRNGSFGQGANAAVNTNWRSTTPGGGGGWYGGGGNCVNDSYGSTSALVYASGGSSYTYTSSTCGNHPNKACLGNLPLMTNAVCYGCADSFPTASGGTETGHSGNGCVRISGG